MGSAYAAAGTTTPVSAAKPYAFTPHKAVYKMKMGSSKNGSSVSDVSGTMTFEWRDACDAWTIKQRMSLHFGYSDGDVQDLVSNELTWESKDGKNYNFNIHRSTGGAESEAYRGKAIQNDDGTVSVTYSLPERKTVTFPAGTLFPTAHTALILQNAEGGEKFFSRQVFDGADEEGSSDISVFVLPRKTKDKEPAVKKKIGKSPLLAQASWPTHLAFFKAGTETGEPDYEMDINLLPNGVARYMKVDYGDFSVVGTLEDIQTLRPQNCP